MTRTLAELNATAVEYDWSDTYRLRSEYAVGKTGGSLRGASGSKVHALNVSRVVKDLRPVEDRRRGTYQEGDNFSVRGLCNGNGQNTGKVMSRLDLADVTCEKCRARLGLDD